MANIDDLDLANTITSVVTEVLSRMSQGGTAAASAGAGRTALRLGWSCTSPEFTCGEYHCVGTVGCSQIFRCTVSFTGLTRATSSTQY